MVQRPDPPLLDVTEPFEMTRLGPQCLIDAYTRLVPIRQTPRTKTQAQRPALAIMTANRRGGEHV